MSSRGFEANTIIRRWEVRWNRVKQGIFWILIWPTCGRQGRRNEFDTYDPMESDRNPTENSKDIGPSGEVVRSLHQIGSSLSRSLTSWNGSGCGEKEQRHGPPPSRGNRVSLYSGDELEINLRVPLVFSSMSGSVEPAFFSIPYQISFFYHLTIHSFWIVAVNRMSDVMVESWATDVVIL